MATESEQIRLFRSCNIFNIAGINDEEIDLLENIPTEESLSTSRQASNTEDKVSIIDQDLADLRLLPPSNLEYLTSDDALKEINSFAATQGYAMVKARSSGKKGKATNRVCLRCWRGGDYDNRGFNPDLDKVSRRTSRSVKMGCKCSMVLYRRPDGR